MWLSEDCPVSQEVIGSVLGQGTSLGCGFSPQSGHMWEIPHQSTCGWRPIDVSFTSMSLPPPFLSRINKYILGWGYKKKKDRNIPFAGPSNCPPLVSTGMVSPESILFTSVALPSQVVPWGGCHGPEPISMILFPLAPTINSDKGT